MVRKNMLVLLVSLLVTLSGIVVTFNIYHNDSEVISVTPLENSMMNRTDYSPSFIVNVSTSSRAVVSIYTYSSDGKNFIENFSVSGRLSITVPTNLSSSLLEAYHLQGYGLHYVYFKLKTSSVSKIVKIGIFTFHKFHFYAKYLNIDQGITDILSYVSKGNATVEWLVDGSFAGKGNNVSINIEKTGSYLLNGIISTRSFIFNATLGYIIVYPRPQVNIEIHSYKDFQNFSYLIIYANVSGGYMSYNPDSPGYPTATIYVNGSPQEHLTPSEGENIFYLSLQGYGPFFINVSVHDRFYGAKSNIIKFD
ncbi:TVG1194688 [Thermoplasma volcanium GSS1]|uniref:TVG1194688 protein n=1 Tax=Thermoplasma volcanium (strain ATCC 51530 / DSM 4299 / JCM 9571 / NBRC 15438 / GSS1) TaxID=273116 RepID=Q979J4_THEVO|nr:hypothetical protein [Thermoplasma volcanium]BAB60309.1 TVG1194688 [Thermoplasma volcanium GSS1]